MTDMIIIKLLVMDIHLLSTGYLTKVSDRVSYKVFFYSIDIIFHHSANWGIAHSIKKVCYNNVNWIPHSM